MSSGKSSDERNPFAPPPEDAPDQPWRPRLPQRPADDGAEGAPEDGERPVGEGRPGRAPVPPPHPWSPNWQGGGGPGWPDRQPGPPQPRFDPNDPQHRRSRYALMSGMAALFCGLQDIASLALLFGALALYWGVSALRPGAQEGAAGTVRAAQAPAEPPSGAPVAWPYGQRSRPQVPAALGGLLTGGVAIALVLGLFSVELAYRPYFTCVNDSLTSVAEQSCSTLAPQWVVTLTDPQN
ncbi:hypothetical protein [Kitasatospora sp. NBC_01266]|uniref:hypothetical protein n=1 Tax=Kitasatospora sp. NBC_01266 TaxID=2903572 RepID=UPI002E30AF02|nr:hypothetical protein [Kitasatospora sp. NBC_01266]